MGNNIQLRPNKNHPLAATQILNTMTENDL